MKKIVLTGGTYVGKTGIIDYMSNQGYTTIGSVGEKNMRLLIDLMGFEVYKQRRKDHFLEFQQMAFFSNLHAYNDSLKISDTKDDIIFYDRGVFDWITSLQKSNIEIPQSLLKQAESISYDVIFLIENIPVHRIKTEKGKFLDEEGSKIREQFIVKEYTKRFGEVIKIPGIYYQDNPDKAFQERSDIIFEHLKKKGIIN